MQQTKEPKTNQTARIVPPIRHTVAWRLKSVTALPGARLRVTFVDGTTGEVDMRGFLGSRKIAGTLFEPLGDPAVFAEARVVLGAVQWPNGADLAPDAMYEEIRAHGRWVLE